MMLRARDRSQQDSAYRFLPRRHLKDDFDSNKTKQKTTTFRFLKSTHLLSLNILSLMGDGSVSLCPIYKDFLHHTSTSTTKILAYLISSLFPLLKGSGQSEAHRETGDMPHLLTIIRLYQHCGWQQTNRFTKRENTSGTQKM